jgi:hypothetical protein
VIPRFALVSIVALVGAATLPACGGGGESCTTCQPEGGSSGAGVGGPGTAGTGASGDAGHGGTTGTGGSSTAGTGGTTGSGGGGTTGQAGNGGGRGGTIGSGGVSGSNGGGGSGAGGVSGSNGGGGSGAGGVSGSNGGGGSGAGGVSGSNGGGGSGAGGVSGSNGGGGAGGIAGTGGSRGGTSGSGGIAGAGGAGGTGGTGIDPDIVLWYKFDDASGTVATDSSGNNRNGTLTSVGGGSAAFSTTNKVPPRSLNLTSSSPTVGGYVIAPASMQTMGATTAVTISMWVYIRTGRQWARVFDFGNSMSTGYMFITVQQNMSTPNSPRLAISKTDNSAEQQINMTTPAPLSTGAWHHLAFTLGAGTTYTGTIYIDKVAAGSNNTMTLRPSDIGNTVNNWIGRSQFTANDSLFDGYIDDLRIYKRALTAAEITALP